MDYCIKCSQPLFHGTIPHRCIADIPCPSCAALRARIEVLEKVAEVAANSFHWDGCDCGACSHFWSVYRKAKEG